MLAQVHDFRAGILYLYEKAKLFQQIVIYHMEKQNYVQVIDTCKKHGTRDSSLWVKALTYFASRPECKTQLREVHPTLILIKIILIRYLIVIQKDAFITDFLVLASVQLIPWVTLYILIYIQYCMI